MADCCNVAHIIVAGSDRLWIENDPKLFCRSLLWLDQSFVRIIVADPAGIWHAGDMGDELIVAETG